MQRHALLAFLLSSLSTPAFGATLAPGETLERALGAHITTAGLDHIGETLVAIAPDTFSIGEMEGEFACSEEDANPLAYSISDLQLQIGIPTFEILPSDGRLDIIVELQIWGSASELSLSGDCSFILSDLDEVCGFDVPSGDPIPLSMHIGVALALVEGAKGATIDATVDAVDVTLGTIDNPLTDCMIADLIDILMSRNPDLIRDLLWTYLEPQLGAIGPAIEEAIEGLSPSLAIDTSFALGSAELGLSLRPSALVVSNDGILLGLSAAVTPSMLSECQDFGQGSEMSGGAWPEPSDFSVAAGDSDALILVSKDLADHLLWNIWATGMFCLDLSDLAGLPLSTELLGSMMGSDFQALFPEEKPASLSIRAPYAPTSELAEDPPLRIVIQGLDVRIEPVFVERVIRIGELIVQGNVDVEIPFEDGVLAPGLIIDPKAFQFEELPSELIGPGYSAGIVSFIPTALESFLPADLLPTVEIPTFQGIGLGSLDWNATENGRWLAGAATIDASEAEPIEMKGCEGGGCDDLGGDTGMDLGALFGCGGDKGCGDTKGCGSCGTAGGLTIPGRWFLGVLAGLVFALRRKNQF